MRSLFNCIYVYNQVMFLPVLTFAQTFKRIQSNYFSANPVGVYFRNWVKLSFHIIEKNLVKLSSLKPERGLKRYTPPIKTYINIEVDNLLIAPKTHSDFKQIRYNQGPS